MAVAKAMGLIGGVDLIESESNQRKWFNYFTA